MKRKTSRALSLILALVFLAALLPTVALAAGEPDPTVANVIDEAELQAAIDDEQVTTINVVENFYINVNVVIPARMTLNIKDGFALNVGVGGTLNVSESAVINILRAEEGVGGTLNVTGDATSDAVLNNAGTINNYGDFYIHQNAQFVNSIGGVDGELINYGDVDANYNITENNGYIENRGTMRQYYGGLTFPNVTFDVNGGTQTEYGVYDGTVNPPTLKLPGATRPGYSFRGWKWEHAEISSNGNSGGGNASHIYKRGYVFPLEENVTAFTAQWSPIIVDPDPPPPPPEKKPEEKKELVTVTAQAQGGGTISPSGTYEVEKGSTLTFTLTPFEGEGLLYLNVDEDKTIYPSSGSYTLTCDADHTVTAVFSERIKKYVTITFFVEGEGSIQVGGQVITDSGEIKAEKGSGIRFSLIHPNKNATARFTDGTAYVTGRETKTDGDSLIFEYSLTNLNSDRTVTAVFAETEVALGIKAEREQDSENVNGLNDVQWGQWCAPAVSIVTNAGVMQGDENRNFNPDNNATRVEIVQTSFNLCTPLAIVRSAGGGVRLMAEEPWYAEALKWALDSKIMEGYGEGELGLTDEITREQFAKILYSLAVSYDLNVTLPEETVILDFTDFMDVSDWAFEAMNWATYKGIVNGFESRLNPQGLATRAEVAQMVANFMVAYGLYSTGE